MDGEVQSLSLFYASLKKTTSDTVNMGLAVKFIHVPHTVEINSVNAS